MKKKSHYETLGVSRDATPEEIKKAYRKAAREGHPDKFPGDKDAEERFRMIVLAHEVLSDPDKKRQYDLGFDPDNGSFDPTVIDPSLLDPEKFIETFAGLFGEYLDARIPGGFTGRVRRAAERVRSGQQQAKKKKKKAAKKKAPKRTTARCVEARVASSFSRGHSRSTLRAGRARCERLAES